MLTPYNFKGVTPYACSGNYFHYDTATAVSGDFGVEVFLNEASVGVFYPGDAYTAPQTFSRIRFQPTTDAVGVIRVGAGRIDSVKVSGTVGISGTPNVAVPGGVVINGAPTVLRPRDIAAAAGRIYGFTQAPAIIAAGNASGFLGMPTDATLRARIRRISFSNIGTGGPNCQLTVRTFSHTWATGGAGTMFHGGALARIAAPTSQMVGGGAFTGYGGAQDVWTRKNTAAGEYTEIEFDGEILLTAGFGIEINFANGVADGCMANVQWWEE